MATFGWSYKSNASGSKRPREQSRKVEEWQKNRTDSTAKPLHPQSHSAETLTAGSQLRKKKYDPRAKIFVGNLDWETKEVTLAENFSTFGEIEAVKVIKDHETGTSRGFAFITFCEVDSAMKCKTWCGYNQLKIDDRTVTVRSAERRQAHQLVEAQKRKAVDKNNPTLYWEYKWTEDAEAEVYGPYETSLMLQWSKAGYFDAGCWVREHVTKESCVEKTEPKIAKLVDQSYADSSDSESDDTPSEGDPEGNDFVHVSELDFSMFP